MDMLRRLISCRIIIIIMRPVSLDWRTDIYMFAVVIAFVCFYHAERILSAITKFFAHLFREEQGRAE